MEKAIKKPNGKWQCRVSFINEKGEYKKKAFTADTKKEAEAKAAVFQMELKHDNSPYNLTLGKLADRYIEDRCNILSPSTIRGYRSIRKTALQDIINVRLGLLTTEMYQKAINEYAKERSPKTVESAHVFYNKLLNANNITIGNNINLPQKEKKEISVPTEEEVTNFLEVLKKEEDIYLYFLIAVTMGLRRSEIVALKWEDIDLENKKISVNKARVKDEFGEYIEKTTKTTKSKRVLQMPQVVIDALGEKGKASERVFTRTPDGLYRRYQRLCEREGFNYTFHTLRHYCASIMLKLGIPNKYAAEIMGHSTENMLQRVYQHTFASDKDKYLDLVSQQMDKLVK